MVKKGITPVISVVLLIMLVIGLTGGAYYWMTNVQEGLQESTGRQVESTTDVTSVKFDIITIICEESDNTVRATLVNNGERIIDASNAIMTLREINGEVLGTDTELTVNPESVSKDESFTIESAGTQWDLADEKSYSVRINIGSSAQMDTCFSS